MAKDRTPSEPSTEAVDRAARALDRVRRFRLNVLDGPDAGASYQSVEDRCSIGSHESNHLVLSDPTVSRFHCEVVIDAAGPRIVDLDSKNGTLVDGMRVREAWLKAGCVIHVGRTSVSFELDTAVNRVPVAEATRLGPLAGTSVAMRTVFAQLERAAHSDATLLLEGETGTGKEGSARVVHESSRRRGGPFVVVDCAAVPATILESELFGHERASFTGASGRRVGAFEEAGGGTVFLDEIGELPLDLQPKLLRVLERREIRRIGSNQYFPVDVRVVAATNRDLRTEVNGGRFRADLYYRLAVLKIVLPPLRQRPEDIPLLVDTLLEQLPATDEQAAALRSPGFLDELRRASWPGNVRELRNYLERCLVFDEAPAWSGADDGSEEVDREPGAELPFVEARRQALAGFERVYLADLMNRHRGKVSAAARAAGIDRNYLYRLLDRHGLR
ncbi:MAG TPA: sigma 54-interacting transcriptional regulator [Kofleriaceae bacterium]|nr:sigma 54-interacting transcriptional regulator [Kofleriaceae bacterium]